MRTILGIAMLLAGIGMMSCRIEGRSSDQALPANHADWVRTIDGWERSDDWLPSLTGPPAVHPVLVASGQVLISLFALVAAAGQSRRDPQQG
jgi:hypothetical protein